MIDPLDELVDILDEQGTFTGKTAMKSEAHLLGLFHSAIHVWCYSMKGKVLLQQRSSQKKTYPLKWDVSVAGHIGAGESPEVGAIREVKEEIGVSISDNELEKIEIFKLERRHSPTLWDREFIHTYLCVLDENVALTKQESEVHALQWMTLAEFENRINKQNSLFVPNSIERYQRILQHIRLRL